MDKNAEGVGNAFVMRSSTWYPLPFSRLHHFREGTQTRSFQSIVLWSAEPLSRKNENCQKNLHTLTASHQWTLSFDSRYLHQYLSPIIYSESLFMPTHALQYVNTGQTVLIDCILDKQCIASTNE